MDCRDDETGLQCWAFEDDSFYPTRRLQGAVTVYAALESAAEAAEYYGEDGDFLNALRARMSELKDAIRAYLYNEEEGEFMPNQFMIDIDSGRHEWNLQSEKNPGAQAWLIWPVGVFKGEAEEASQAEKLLEYVRPHLEGKTEGFSYLGKILIALALFYRNDPDKMAEVRELANILLKDVPTQDTHHMGEVVVSIDTDGDGVADVFDNRVAIPHVWEQSLGYMLAMAVYSPEAFSSFETSLQKSPSCTCSHSPAGPDGIFTIVLAMIIFLVPWCVFRMKYRGVA